MEKRTIHLFAKVAIGASGAPTISAANSKGIVSITRNSTGTYTVVFGTTATMLDTFYKFMGFTSTFIKASGVASAPITYVKADNTAVAGTASLQFVCTDYAGAAADPASGETMLLTFVFGDSSAP